MAMMMHQEAVKHLGRVEPILGSLMRTVGPCTLRHKNRRSPFEALLTAVAYQQLNGTAAATILGRVKALFPEKKFPTPEDLLAMPEERLRGAGLSRAKTIAF